jgi:DNA-directed RNA polymerase specialized sigma24 family protein
MSLSLLPPPTESDLDLLCAIGLYAVVDVNEANVALGKLYERHGKFVANRLGALAASYPAIDPEQLTLDTFERAFRCAGRFKDQSGNDADRLRQQVRKWLMQIATNLFFDELRLVKNQIALLTDAVEDLPENPFDNGTAPFVSASTLRMIDEAFAALNEQDDDIIRTYAYYGALGEDSSNLPSEDRDRLMSRYGLTNTALRQRKKRALERLRAQGTR